MEYSTTKTNIKEERKKPQNDPWLFGMLAVAGMCMLFLIGDSQESGRNSTKFITETEYYQRLWDLERAAFDGYKEGVNDAR